MLEEEEGGLACFDREVLLDLLAFLAAEGRAEEKSLGGPDRHEHPYKHQRDRQEGFALWVHDNFKVGDDTWKRNVPVAVNFGRQSLAKAPSAAYM